MVQDDKPVGLDGVNVVFDDEKVVSDAGIALVATLAQRLGVEALAGDLVRLRRDRSGAANAGRKIMTLVYAMVLGADSIDDTGVLRAGRTGRLLGGWIPAPSTLGTFLRAFTFGHVRQLDALLGRALECAWKGGRRPGRGQVGDRCRQLRRRGLRAAQARCRLRLHPAAGLSPDPRHPRRHARGAAHPPAEGIGEHAEGDAALHRRADRARGPRRRDRRQAVRADSGFWNTKVFERLERAGWQYSIGVRMIKTVRVAVDAIDEDAWTTIEDYPDEGEAQIAETVYGGRRLIVRRTRLVGAQAELWPDWRHFALITNRSEDIALVEAEHRDHAVVEQDDLKDQALAHFPSGQFSANGAWTVLGVMAHNMPRWTQLLGLPETTIRAARTLRRRLLSVPGRLTRHARGWKLHLPARWPWHGDYISALNKIRALPAPA
ncbi:MAG: transposase [Solirubrobacteraceae bacterium]